MGNEPEKKKEIASLPEQEVLGMLQPYTFLNTGFGDLCDACEHVRISAPNAEVGMPLAPEAANSETEQVVVERQAIQEIPGEASSPAPLPQRIEQREDRSVCFECGDELKGECNAAHVHYNNTVKWYFVIT